MNSILAKIGAVILAICSYIATAPDSLQGMIPPLLPDRYRGLVSLIFAIAAYTAHQYGSAQSTQASVTTALKKFVPVLLCGMVLMFSGCQATNTIAGGVANKSNNASIGLTGLKLSACDPMVGGLPAATIGSGHASLLTRRDGQPAQVTIHNSYSWVPGDSSLSYSDISINFGNTVSSFNSTYTGTAATVQFSETK